MAIREALPITVLAFVHIFAAGTALWVLWASQYMTPWSLFVAFLNAIVILMWLVILRYNWTKP